MNKPCIYSLFAAALTVTAAHADTVTFTLNQSAASTVPGGTASYSATISAPGSNTAPVFLNGDTITFAGPTDISFDDSDLFGNFPVSLNPGDSDTEALFTASVPANELAGSYLGSFVLEGGADGNTFGTLGTQQFTLNVNATNPSSVTPEPSSFLLLSTGAVAVLCFTARRRMVDGTQL